MLNILLLLFFAAMISCKGVRNERDQWSRSGYDSSMRQTANSICKSDVKFVEKSDFSLYAPVSFLEHRMEGEDSRLWEFGDENITVIVESGLETMTLDRTLEHYDEYREEQRTIGGDPVKIVSFSYGDESYLLKNPEKSLVVAGHFRKSNRNLIVWINFRSEQCRAVVTQIMESFRFKE